MAPEDSNVRLGSIVTTKALRIRTSQSCGSPLFIVSPDGQAFWPDGPLRRQRSNTSMSISTPSPGDSGG